VIRFFMNTLCWPIRFGMDELGNESTRRKNCIAVSVKQMSDPNLSQLIAAADALRPLLGELVFVGGCVTGLLITDEAAGDPRRTFDVDAIAEITSYVQYIDFGERLRTLGFTEDTTEGAHFVAGSAPGSSWMSCHSTRKFLGSPTAGTRPRCKPR